MGQRIVPTRNAIVAKAIKSERVSQGGIVIPETEAQKRDIASVKMEVVDIGPMAFEDEMFFEKEYGVQIRKPQIGDTVLTSKFAGHSLKLWENEKLSEYRVLWASDIVAVLEEDDV